MQYDYDVKEIENVIEKIKSCRNELNKIKDDIDYPVYKKAYSEINTAISALNRSIKELDNVKPLEGQIFLEDMLDDFEIE